MIMYFYFTVEKIHSITHNVDKREKGLYNLTARLFLCQPRSELCGGEKVNVPKTAGFLHRWWFLSSAVCCGVLTRRCTSTRARWARRIPLGIVTGMSNLLGGTISTSSCDPIITDYQQTTMWCLLVGSLVSRRRDNKNEK
jgi:hypothetical protein